MLTATELSKKAAELTTLIITTNAADVKACMNSVETQKELAHLTLTICGQLVGAFVTTTVMSIDNPLLIEAMRRQFNEYLPDVIDTAIKSVEKLTTH